jgi:hypothetical protein
MRHSSPAIWRRSVVGACLTLLTAVLLAPSRAEASCSHYVIWRGIAVPAPLGLDRLNPESLAAAVADAGVFTPDTPPSNPAEPKCSGVLCSGSPATPEIPASTPSGGFDHWGFLEQTVSPASTEPAFEPRENDRLRPVDTGTGVFHPPRVAR